MAASVPDAVGGAALRPMREADLPAIMDIERRAYPFPWTLGIFRDCLRAGYPGLVLAEPQGLVGYAMLSMAADEAHVLNVCVAPGRQGHGYGRRLLHALLHAARKAGAQRVFLEVRPSNRAAIALYHDEGFNEIGRRPRYYPARDGREDAIVMALELLGTDAMPALR